MLGKQLPQRKVLAVGEDGTGKATLLHTLTTGTYPEPWRSVLSCSGDVKEVSLPSQRTRVELSLWTAPGEEQYRQVRPLSYLDTRVVLLCYSVNRPETFHVIPKTWIQEIRKHSRKGTPVVLVGTKSDLRSSEDNIDEKEEGEEIKACHCPFVTTKQGQKMAKLIGAAAFVECSAKKDLNLQELLNTTAELAMIKRKRKSQKADIQRCMIS